MTDAKTILPATAALAVVEALRADMGGHHNLDSRIEQEVLRLRGEGQDELADALAVLCGKVS